MMRRLGFVLLLLPCGLVALLPAFVCVVARAAAWVATGRDDETLLLPGWLRSLCDLPWRIKGDPA